MLVSLAPPPKTGQSEDQSSKCRVADKRRGRIDLPSDLSLSVRITRVKLRYFGTGNVAIFEVCLPDGTWQYFGAISVQEGGDKYGKHAEARLDRKLTQLGIKPEYVTRVYTELQPCARCGPLLRGKYPNAYVTCRFTRNPNDHRHGEPARAEELWNLSNTSDPGR